MGVGTANPTVKLDVSGRGNFTTTSYINGGVANSGGINIAGLSTASSMQLGVGDGSTAAFGWIQIGQNASQAQGFALALNPQGGNVGIATTAPTNKLVVDVSTNAQGISINAANSGSNPALSFTNQGSLKGVLALNTTAAAWSANTGVNDLILHTDGTSFAVDTNVFNGGSPSLIVKAGGNVGIGSTSPFRKLSVSGSGIFTGGDVTASTFTATSSISTPSLTLSGTAINSILSTNASGAIVATSTITANNIWATSTSLTNYFAGNVGIGTTNPGAKLEVGTGSLRLQGTASDPAYYTDMYTSYVSPAVFNIELKTSGYSAASVLQATGGASPKTVLMNGNIGIGTTSPAASLEILTNSVAGYALNFLGRAADNATTINFYDVNRSSRYGFLFTDATVMQMHTVAAIPLTLGTSGSERMRITSGGNVGIGTTPPVASLTIAGATGTLFGLNSTTGSQYASWSINTGAVTSSLAVNNLTITNSIAGNGSLAFNGNNVTLGSIGIVTVGSGTSNSEINLTTGSGDIKFLTNAGTERMRIQSTTGNVGIGTTSPISSLSVAHATTPTFTLAANDGTGYLRMIGSGGVNYIQSGLTQAIGSEAQLRFTNISANETWMTLDTTGNVGIGTTTPTTKLLVEGNSSVRFGINEVADSTNSHLSGIDFFDNAVFKGGLYKVGDTNDLTIWDATSRKVTFQQGGNVGIGTTSPVQKLEVAGLMRSAASYAGIEMIDPTNNSGYTAFANGGKLNFASGTLSGSIRMTLDSSGNVGIGTTTPFGSLAVNNIAGQPGFVVGSSTRTSFIVDKNGNVGIGTTNPTRHLQVSAISGDTQIAAVDVTGNKAYFRADANNGAVKQTFGTDTIGGFMYMETNHPFYIETPNDVYFKPGSSEKVRFTSGGNVGIGSTSPTALLAVNAPAGQASFAVGSSTATSFIIDKNGNVGVGTVNPWQKLDVRSSDATAPTINIYSTPSAYTAQMVVGTLALGSNAAGNDVLAAYVKGISETNASSANGALSFGTRLAGTPTEWMRINSSGNVGIGTTTPTWKLQISSAGTYTSDAAGAFAITDSTTPTKKLFMGYDAAVGANGSAFIQSENQGVTVTPLLLNPNGGNVGIGTAAPTDALNVVTTTNDKGIALHNGTTNLLFRVARNGSADNMFMNMYSAGVVTNQIVSSGSSYFNAGNVGIGTTSPTALLNVGGTGVDTDFRISRNANGNYIGVSAPGGTVMRSSITLNGTAALTLQGNGGVGVGSGAGYADGTVTYPANGMLVQGNVGVGTTSPDSSLMISKDSTLSGIGNGITINSATTGTKRLNFGVVPASNYSFIDTINYSISNTSQALALQPSGGNVGIGTTTPNVTLNVVGSGITSQNYTTGAFGAISTYNNAGAGLNIYALGSTYGGTIFGGVTGNNQAVIESNSGASSLYVGTSAGYPIIFAPNRTAAMTIMNGGNVGIGTTSPISTLSVAHATAPTFTLAANDGTGYLRMISTGSVNYIQSGLTQAVGSEAPLRFTNVSANETWMTLATDGNVGIGTTSPNAKLAVEGSSTVRFGINEVSDTTINDLSGIDFFDNATFKGGFYKVGSTNDFTIWDATSRKVTFQQGGNVGIGTTSPLATLSVAGNARIGTSGGALVGGAGLEIDTFSISGDGSPYGARSLILKTVNSTTANSAIAWVNSANTIQGVIGRNYNVANSTFEIVNSAGTTAFLLDSNSNVGIGTTTPFGSLAVNNVAGQPGFVVGSSTATSFIVDKNGNVGVGTITPASKLDVSGTLTVGTNTGRASISTWFSNTASWIDMPTSGPSGIGSGGAGTNPWVAYVASASQWFSDSTAGDIAYRNSAGKLLFGNTTGSSGMVLSGDNLGIGTTTPSAKLAVNAPAGVTSFAVGSSTKTSLIVDRNGNVGIGTAVTTQEFTISAGDIAMDSGRQIYFAGGTDTNWRMGRATGAVTKALLSSNTLVFLVAGSRNEGVAFGVNGGNSILELSGSSLAAYFRGNVGIGLTSTTRLLSINAPAGQDPFYIGSSTTQFLVDILGNVSMGTSSSATTYYNTNPYQLLASSSARTLQITGTQSAINLMSSQNSDNGTIGALMFSRTNAQSDAHINVAGIRALQKGTGATAGAELAFHTKSTGSPLEAMRLTQNGNLGIGTTTASQKLQVDGQIFVAPSSASYDPGGGVGPGVRIGYDSSGGYGYVLANTTGVANRPLFLGSGNVGIGTNNPVVVLDVRGENDGATNNVREMIAMIRETSGTVANGFGARMPIVLEDAGGSLINAGAIQAVWEDSSAANRFPRLGLMITKQNGGFSEALSVNKDSNVGIATTSPWRKFSVTGTVSFASLSAAASGDSALCLSSSNEVRVNSGTATCTVSSARFKNTIATSTINALDLVNAMRPVSYYYNNDTTNSEHFGFIAEEVDLLEPRLVARNSDGQIQSVRYEEFTSVLAKAVQEMSIKVDDLETRLTALEATVASSTPAVGGITFAEVLSSLESLGARFVNGIAYLKDVFVDNLTIGTAEKPSGITLYDEVTGEPYCLKVANGAMVSAAGICGSQTATSTPPTSGNATTTDTIAPEISLMGNNPAVIQVGSSYVDLGATVMDMGINPLDPSGPLVPNTNLGIQYSVNGVSMTEITIDTATTSTHTIVFSAVDMAGNWGHATRTVEVIPMQ